MTHIIDWSAVRPADVEAAIEEFDRLGPTAFFAQNGFAPATTYELFWNGSTYPPKAILGRAYEISTTTCLASRDFEGGKSGAVKILRRLGFEVEPKRM